VAIEERINHLFNQAKKNAELIHVLEEQNKMKDVLIQKLEKLLNDQGGAALNVSSSDICSQI